MLADIGFDIGTYSFLAVAKNKGIVLNEPMILYKDNGNKNFFFGKSAKEIQGRENNNISIIRPIQGGSIYDITSLQEIIKKSIKMLCGNGIMRPKVLINIPSYATDIEKKTIINLAKNFGGARSVKLIDNSLASAIGAGWNVNLPTGIMVIDIGGGTCDVGVISLGGVIASTTIPIGGDTFDKAIINYIKSNYRVLIGDATAEKIKIEVGSCFPSVEKNYVVSGRCLRSGLPIKIKVTSEELRMCLSPYLVSIAQGVRQIISKVHPEIVSDIMKYGIILCGGSASLSGFCDFIHYTTGIKSYLSGEPSLCTIRGIQKIIEGEIKPLGWSMS